ncbi:nitrilase-related carbon-nitrogen hydrolase [Azohydromonas australica]|uniref:nitrilase-related carbon-nitrogen hydrolase n=1 Tax=Azohydromonas australica TaxID=364039 RepID=UPI0009FF4F0C|nr:nitrilase-related carbon-nitrogen hydrolase [Azohydromonas australica]
MNNGVVINHYRRIVAIPSIKPDSFQNPDARDGESEVSLSRRRLLRGLSIAGLPLAASQMSGCGGANAAEPDTSTPPAATDGSTAPSSSISITTAPFTVALVHKLASSTFDISEAVTSLISFMAEAKATGASLVVAGELYLPGYDVNINYTTDWATKMWPTIKANSLSIGDGNWIRLLDAARSLGVAVSFGFSEKADKYYYMSQALIGNDGTVWNKRRKVRPSGAERNYWSDAPMAGNLNVVTTPLGRISMLMCWDHLRPQSTFNVMAQLPNIHVCAWPYTRDTTVATPGWDRQEVAHSAAAYFSQLSGAVTLLATVGYCAVYKSSIKLAELAPADPANMLYYTITPGKWTGATSSTTSEFSYGVLQLLADNYPGQKVADSEHGTLNLNAES